MTPKALLLLVAISASGFLTTSVSQAERNCLQISYTMKMMDPRVPLTVTSTLASHGICVNIRKVPASRATVMIKNGQLDGEIGRVSRYGNIVGDMVIRVPVSIGEGYGLIVSISEDLLAFDQLAGLPVGMERGVRWYKSIFPPNAVPVVVDDYAAGLKMLETKRIAALLIDSFSLSRIKTKPTPLFTQQITPELSAYLYLHKKHDGLAKQVENAMREWRKEFYENAGDLRTGTN